MQKTIFVVIAILSVGCGDPNRAIADGGLCNRDGGSIGNACGPDLSEGGCSAVGGKFTHPSEFRTVCLCPTQDANCPCTSSTECEGYCELRGATTVSQCTYATGVCTPFKRFLSCACVVGESAVLHIPPHEAQMICVE